MTKKMLIVEDDDDLREWLAFELESEGYEVIVAEGGQAALKAIEKSPHLVLLDVQLPDIDGFEVCQMIQSRPETATIPIIFLTARSDLASKITGFDHGAVDYVTKPFIMAELKARIRATLRAQQLEQQRAEANLEQYKIYLSQNLSHELRTPMSIILSALDIMDYTIAQKKFSELNSVIGAAQNGAYKLHALIQDLLIINKISQNKIIVYRQPTMLKATIDTILQPLLGRYHTKKLTFSIDVQHDDYIPIAHNHLSDILRHLIDNACKFSPPEGLIQINLSHTTDKQLTLCVTDQGKGIPIDQQELIFQKFYQVDMSMTRDAEGLGAGLFIARALARLYGGDIRLRSDANSGSQFCLTMPIEPD